MTPHCPACAPRCHKHGDGECDGEYFTDQPSPVPACVECPGYGDEPELHQLCAVHFPGD